MPVQKISKYAGDWVNRKNAHQSQHVFVRDSWSQLHQPEDNYFDDDPMQQIGHIAGSAATLSPKQCKTGFGRCDGRHAAASLWTIHRIPHEWIHCLR